MKTYWISFAPNNPDEHNLGCCIVDAVNQKDALAKTIELKINPGGEVLIVEMPPYDPGTHACIAAHGKNRLIPYNELVKDTGVTVEPMNSMKIVKQVFDELDATIVCEECNNMFPHKHHH